MSLSVIRTTAYDLKWSDRGSGAARDGGFWHPKAQGNLRPLGSVAIGSFEDINGQYETILVGAATPGNGAVASPTDYTLLWTDRGSGAKADGSFWRPVAPSGYIALGDVAQGSWDKPDTNRIWCVKENYSQNGRYAAQSVWDDKKSGAKSDVSIWAIHKNVKHDNDLEALSIGAFRANQGYSPPDTAFADVLNHVAPPRT